MRTHPTRNRTLRSLILRTTATNLAATAVGVLVWSAGGGVAGDTTASWSQSPETAVSRVETLLARHHCWSGRAPVGAPAPTHALVTPPGGRAHLVPAAVGYGIWLDGKPGVLHAFCR